MGSDECLNGDKTKSDETKDIARIYEYDRTDRNQFTEDESDKQGND